MLYVPPKPKPGLPEEFRGIFASHYPQIPPQCWQLMSCQCSSTSTVFLERCAFSPPCPCHVLMQKFVTITESQDAPVWFDLMRGWEDSATLLAEGIHALRVLCTALGHCWGPGPAWGCKLLTFPRNPVLDLCWKPHVGTPWNQNLETESCQISRNLYCLSHFLPNYQRKSQPCFCCSCSVWSGTSHSNGVSDCQFLVPGSLLLAVVWERESSSGKCHCSGFVSKVEQNV